MKRAYQKVMSVLLVCLFVISGCSSGNSGASASPKQVLLDAVEYSNQQEGFHEEYDHKVTSEDGVRHTLNDNYIIYPSQNCYQLGFQSAVGGSYRSIYISKYTQPDLTYIQGTPSSSSFRDMNVMSLGSYEERNEAITDHQYFTSLFEMFTASDVSELVSFEMEKNDEGYRITIQLTDMDRFNEINREKTLEQYGEDWYDPYLEFCMTVQINKGIIQKVTWDEKVDRDGVIQERVSTATYTPCSIDQVDTALIDDLVNQVKVGTISENSYLTLDGIVR